MGARWPPQPLKDYAFLGDGERGALIGPHGEIAWMCAPRWHDEPVFASLVGRGSFAVTPLGEHYVWGGHYEDGSLIWRSRWITGGSVVECREALARPAEKGVAVLLRRIECLEGEVRMRVQLDPRDAGGDGGLRDLARHDDGIWTGRVGELTLRCSGIPDARFEPEDGLLEELSLREGQRHDLVVEIAAGRDLHSLPSAAACWQETQREWESEVPDLSGVWARRDVRQAYAVIAGLTTADGGMVAAASRSLPERAERGRDFDYRYAWIRDQAMVGQAVAAVGPHRLLDCALRFVGDRIRADGTRLHPAYTVAGEPVPPEQSSQLAGYPGGRDHRGNRAGRQFQLDVFGEALHLFAAAARLGPLDAEQWRAVLTTVEAIEKLSSRPDSGIWELEERRWAHSRLMLVTGLHAIAEVAPRPQAVHWVRLADAILGSVESDCVHPAGRWQRAAGDPRVDSALLIPVMRWWTDPAQDPRAMPTVQAILDDLSDDEFCYRFDQGGGDLADTEGAFVLSGFHMSMALKRLGHDRLAARWFERNRASYGTPGLFSEEYDLEQRQQRGNLPQAFVHGALIEASTRLSS